MGVWVFFVFVLGLCVQVHVLNCQNITCNSNDLQALEGFIKGLESVVDGWGVIANVSSSSSSSNCCNWVGISCESSRITGLVLVKKKLRGGLSESLAGLDHLKVLNLSRNFLKGPLPTKLFQLQKLAVLDLSSNEFNGSIPGGSDLPSIQILDLSGNSIGHAIDSGICKNSTQIRVLNLSMNHLIGSFPIGLGSCTSLQYLGLNSNFLLGNLPEDLFGLPNLKQLYIQNNLLSGPLSGRIGNLTNLVHLDISLNGFSGLIPDVFGRLTKLEQLSANSNKFNGSIPTSLSNSPTIQLLTVRNNSLSGSINLNCTSMVRLSSLDLGSNQFVGPLPESLSSCRQLRAVNLGRNFLNCTVPESFSRLQSLSYLSFSNTSLHNISGALSVLQQCKSLKTLVLTMNFHFEEMPANANLQFGNLTALVIANCGLSGSIPQWLRGCSKLQVLDLSWNHLDGVIPDYFGQMKFLFYLDLSNNTLSGDIPVSLTEMEGLVNSSIPIEEPTPDFPLFIKRNQSAMGLQYNQILSLPPSLELSYNKLTGPIWPQFGNLTNILVLDLKENHLAGSIPDELSGMRNLECLDLSHNNLSGTLPPSLTKLSFLSRFSVAFNQLVGRVPSGGQFLTFPTSSFEGNKGLCDEHNNPCHKDRPVHLFPQKSKKVGRNKGVIVGMVIGIGFGTVFLLALMFLIVTRTTCPRHDDPEKNETDANDNDMNASAQNSVVLFESKESDKELSIEDLLKSTNNFDQANIIGCGGFGLVYKATLPDGRKVAIKRLSGDCGQMDREFHAEVETLSRAQHENLVLLQGYCRCKNDRLLIYSYMENGSLDYWLHEKLDGACLLNWETRLHIAQGSARGLAYLHQSCEPHILHRDVKSSNILLDENFEAHLADFGLARLLLPYDTHVSTDLVGTLGYIPPEYGQASVATFKGDVYSFGVVLLELLTGKRPMDMCKPKGCRDLISWVQQMKKEKREVEVLDPFIYDKQNDKQMLLVLEIACLCLNESPKLRPSTQQIVFWLDNIELCGQLTKC